jgi:plasmid maintenance system antidote protein VapI
MMGREVPLIHPGQILLLDWRINEIVLGRRSITADTAARLAAFFGVSAQDWLNLQASYDVQTAQERLADELSRIPRYDSSAYGVLIAHGRLEGNDVRR